MTKAGIKRAFRGLDTTSQAEVLHELAASLARSLADEDKQDVRMVRRQRGEEKHATPIAEVRRRLLGGRKTR